MVKRAITILGILSVALVVGLGIARYCVDTLFPFLDERKKVRVKIKTAETYEKWKHYKRKYRWMKLEVLPIIGEIFRMIHEGRRERRYTRRY